MRINHNISALNACNILGKTNKRLDTSLERLSSGYRINRAADDAAGLAISEKMKTQIAGLEQASRNASDGISVIQTAEGALVEVETMLQRMRELSVQAANGVNTDEDRAALQDEIDQLNDEINRVSTTTEFNTKKLLNGTVDRRSYSNRENVELISTSDSVRSTDYKMTVGVAPEPAEVFTEFGTGDIKAGKFSINGGTEVVVTGTESKEEVYAQLRNVGEAANVKVIPIKYKKDADGNIEKNNDGKPKYEEVNFQEADGLMFTTNDYGTDAKLEIYCNNSELSDAFGLEEKNIATGKDTGVTLGEGFGKTATVSVNGDYVTVRDLDDFEMKFKVDGAVEEVTISVLDAGPMHLQIGANEGQDIEVRVPRVDTDTLEISDVNVCTQEGAQKAITSFEAAINQVSSIRAKLGAYQNRLEHAINSLDVAAENLTESLSRIADTDMAKEMAQLTQQQVLSQAGTSMLAQANERPQNVLQLLQS